MDLNLRMLGRAFALHAEKPFDLIHAHDWLVAHAAIHFKRATGVPLVMTIHATERGRQHGINGPLQEYIHQMEWWANFDSWKSIICSHAMQNELFESFNVPADKLTIIPNGVQAEKFHTDFDKAAFRANFAQPHEPLIMTVARMVPEKGIATLVEAMPRLLEMHHTAKVVICGRGPMLDQYRGLAAALGLGDRVHFTGFIDDDSLQKLFQVADAAVFPSLYEPFGIVALEGMAAGLPTIVSDVGGMAEIVKDGVNGLKVPPNNPGALAWALHRVISSPEWGRSLGATGRAETETIYNWDRIAEQTAGVYEAILGSQDKP
jgi:glycogen(starch) synthase